MIHFILLQNRVGKTRLAKFYIPVDDAGQAQIKRQVHVIVNTRDTRATNFVSYESIKLVYRRYAGLFFILGIDQEDNDLMYVELIHLLVEVLDMFFKDVCELDLIFNFHKVFMIIDEMIMGGEIQEVSRPVILNRLQELEISSK
ncbi:putative clathrin coat assembly protein AP17 [Leishmania major strain Friedlin]|uniref:AP complex subunit sigma n=1 Tax=Leishmania major TaxID=5664 RepID=Q4Q2W7_LEIMA|nr:putative clathrin coat assembly protein AP17 [Leishmania major strain Friedlin]CAG9582105.1 clathrin_coat_assembly_protein_AP17_-_putative [Leishmania major strain Friedlin]CAJ07946.1 putative clathrin coat assembly protein AP17 [Leishmania major strain Friedlin]|eukprot:XP_001686331.1 putative clathrin coat assembly protein AP17 [Leishmania major strain Friedlin]